MTNITLAALRFDYTIQSYIHNSDCILPLAENVEKDC